MNLLAVVLTSWLLDLTTESETAGWTAVPYGVKTDFDWETSSMEIKTDSEINSNDYMFLYLYSASGDYAGGVHVYFTSSIQYQIEWCMSSWADFPSSPPSESDKVWRITITRTSDGGTRVVIHCNEVELVNILLSDSTCSRADWSSTWNRDRPTIYFWPGFYGADHYRQGEGVSSSSTCTPLPTKVVEYPNKYCINAYTKIGNCDGWNTISKEICIQYCEDNMSPDSTTCPPPAGGCRYAMWNHRGNWCQLIGDSCDWGDSTYRTVVDTKAD